jgi:AraC-like DNA-binding protein
MEMDPLSDVLSLLKPRSYVSGGFGVNHEVAVRFPTHKGIKCYAVLSGRCWLSLDGVAEPVELTAGDCFLLPSGRSFCLATNLKVEPIDFYVLRDRLQRGEIVAACPGEDAGCFLAGGHFLLSGGHVEMLLGALPPVVHIRKDSDKAAMRWSLERMRVELNDPQPGGSLIAQQLATMMLVQALRLHLAEGLGGGVGWLFALADKQMSAAITAMHGDPAYRWTLQGLAERAGMSRSAFALRFKQTVGESPMEYLTRWRMMLAGDKLGSSGEPVSAIALGLGYESESAFSTAFKRVMGCSPRQYGRGGVKKKVAVRELELVAS